MGDSVPGSAPRRQPPLTAHSFTVNAKNITVSVDNETYRRARIAAAANDTSVSATVRALLEEIAANQAERHAAFNSAAEARLDKYLPPEPVGETPEQRFERMRLKEIEIRKRIKGFSAGDRLTREELYDQSKKW